MMRTAASFLAKRQAQEAPAVLVAQRGYIAPAGVSFTEDVSIAKAAAKDAPSILEDWKSKAAGTAQLMQLLQTYKDLGDSKSEPYLKFHNPRSFEDLSKPVPNFRALTLKAGDVPKFFDSVLQSRAADAVAQKSQWWAQRKQEAEEAAKGKSAKGLPTVAVPEWTYGKSVSLESLKKTTDAYVSKMVPQRKLKVAALPADAKEAIASYAKSLKQDASAAEVSDLVVKALAETAVVEEAGKPVEGFKFVSKAVAARVVSTRRAEVQERFLKFWAKKLLVSPELAVVPLKEVDYQLASKFEGVAPAYAELLSAVSTGSKTLGERVAGAPSLKGFFLKRESAADVAAEFPATEAEVKGAELAKKLEDPAVALETLLGPLVQALGEGKGPLSAQVRAVTAHKYAPERYMYKEGMKLAAKLEAEEAALVAELKPLFGDNVDVLKHQLQPRTPVQQVFDRMREIDARAGEFEAEKAAADSPYAEYAVAKKQEFLKDPSNIAFDELLAPGLVEEWMNIELAELAEAEAAIDEAEEEELWSLTLAAQFKHIQKHIGVDLPHGVVAHMDPVLVKKVDWETTNNLEDWDITLDDMGSEYAKEQWGLETLSHHFLPLIRYRRAKAQKAGRKFEPELVAPVRN